jgi:putative oxidoreductase
MGFLVGKKMDIQLNNMVKNLFCNQWIELAARLTLGVTFVYASYHKILAPAEFAKLVYGYGLFPHETINLIAITIPFIELISGIALITGTYTRSAALIIIGMLIAFIIIISTNVIRGHEFDCGCFSMEANKAANSAIYILGRNIILLIFGGYIFMYGLDKPRLSVSMKA